MPNIDKLASALTKPGPHRVLKGDLAFAGIPGVVFTPEDGLGLPAVAFGHNWMVSPRNYEGTLRHLASWGIVAAAPGTQRGPIPSHSALANDLSVTLDICTGVRLGRGKISVRPGRLAVIGHGMGAGAAVLAAAARDDVAAVAALFPAPTSPSSVDAIRSVAAPTLVLAAPGDLDSLTSNARDLADAHRGTTVLRSVDKANADGLVEGRRLLAALGVGDPDKHTQKSVRALLTGFLLHTLVGDDDYADFAVADAVIKGSLAIDPSDPDPEPVTRSRPSAISGLKMARSLVKR